MADPASYRPAAGTIPDQPGVYRFYDKAGRVIYVGKAKSLRSRLSSYFQDITALHTRTRQMVMTGARVDWTVVTTEVEALQLEYSWIKEFDPRFNVRYRDDKSYPSLAVTLNEEFPRLQVMRGPKKKGVRYFGPYAHAWAIRETLDLLTRVFPARTCSNGVFRRHGQMGRPCLLGYLDKCSAPCIGRVTAEEHRAIVDDFCEFMAGKTDRIEARLRRQMQEASKNLEFERAARIRDDLAALTKVTEKNAVVLPDGTDCDVVAFAQDDLEAAVQVFYVRGGRVRGRRGWVVDKVEEVTTAQLVEQYLLQVYDSDEPATTIPRTILVPELPPDADAVAKRLSELRGSQVSIAVPRRGAKKDLLQTVQRNAQEAFTQHRLKRASDLTARSQALGELQEALALNDAPLRIECVDVSHVQGTNVVASLVVFEDGLPKKSDYRRFSIRGAMRGGESIDVHQARAGEGVDDTAAIAEVVTRRFKRHLVDPVGGTDEQTGRPRRFAYPPNLFIVDGGSPQVAAASDALTELGITDIAVIGIAKRLEEIWVPGESEPYILPRTSEAMYLVQRIRDEAHRFAIAFHRQKRGKAMLTSTLDGIPGLGEAKRKALLASFGSVRSLRQASVEALTAVPGIGPATARSILDALDDGTEQPVAVDPTTGEVLDTQ
ncbi:excinuclease ABC subunit UvrC [Blastococcus sp. Marseille-P5729]|uniref:excinuclease ABC subunit UvrC n=1 Tax=Blastococcus sp. Marseille-P5729 TaxID=2086582 RepID=UPI000D112188|nr:excinuclease ABC subunit UvrC [Blastococcus sp. Marseille-P5729]